MAGAVQISVHRPINRTELPKLFDPGRAPRFGVAHRGFPGSVSVKLVKTPRLLEKQHAHFSAAGGTKSSLKGGKAVKDGRPGGHRLCTRSAEDWEEAAIIRRRLVLGEMPQVPFTAGAFTGSACMRMPERRCAVPAYVLEPHRLAADHGLRLLLANDDRIAG